MTSKISAQVMDRVFDIRKQSTHVSRMSVNVTVPVTGVAFDLVDQVFHMMEKPIDFFHVTLQSHNATAVMGNFVNVSGFCVHARCIAKQMTGLRNMGVVETQFAVQLFGLPLQSQRQVVHVTEVRRLCG